MLIILAVVVVGAFAVANSIRDIFFTNIYLNGVILAVFIFGVLACFWQVFTLTSAVNWIEGFALDRPGHEFSAAPRLLASLAALLRDAESRKSLTSSSTRSILDSVSQRLDEARDITRYIINLLIFLGLLGTFYGLATTVPAVVDTIRSLAPQEGQSSIDVFDNLMSGLESQLGGMGTAFASSLLGLAGSLIVGLLELFAGHGQNRFYSELEEWLSSITRITLVGDSGDGGAVSSVARLVEQSTRQADSLREIVLRGEEKRVETDIKLGRLADAVGALAQQLQSQPQAAPASNGVDSGVMSKLLEGQERIAAAQERAADYLENQGDQAGQLDAESRMRLRNIDVQLLKILEEMAAGRQDAVGDLRKDLAALTETIRAAIHQG
jgi:hypothetical protein